MQARERELCRGIPATGLRRLTTTAVRLRITPTARIPTVATVDTRRRVITAGRALTPRRAPAAAVPVAAVPVATTVVVAAEARIVAAVVTPVAAATAVVTTKRNNQADSPGPLRFFGAGFFLAKPSWRFGVPPTASCNSLFRTVLDVVISGARHGSTS